MAIAKAIAGQVAKKPGKLKGSKQLAVTGCRPFGPGCGRWASIQTEVSTRYMRLPGFAGARRLVVIGRV
ncbi:MAG: hypothetical protein Q8M37_06865, partial [Nevskia sp.]|nr:hypothetical protein [Nevskia sp.]